MTKKWQRLHDCSPVPFTVLYWGTTSVWRSSKHLFVGQSVCGQSGDIRDIPKEDWQDKRQHREVCLF